MSTFSALQLTDGDYVGRETWEKN